MLLVDHDQAEPLDRREHRRARPHAHARLALAQPPPLLAALGRGEARVQHRHGLAEARDEATHDLRRQRDLGDQHDRPPAPRERTRRRAQVDLGLARAGDAVQQQRGRSSPVLSAERAFEPLQRRPLVGGQRGAARRAAPPPPRTAPGRPGAPPRARGAGARRGRPARGRSRPAAAPAVERAQTSSSTRRRSTRPAPRDPPARPAPARAGARAASPRPPRCARRGPSRRRASSRRRERHHQHRADGHDPIPEHRRQPVVERPAQRAGRRQRLDLGDRAWHLKEEGPGSPAYGGLRHPLSPQPTGGVGCSDRRGCAQPGGLAQLLGRSVRSHVKSWSSRPKWPYAAVFW